MQTEDEAFKTLLNTVEFMGSRLAAVELVARALWVTHPQPQEALTYLERHLGQTLVQPGLLDRPGMAASMRRCVENLVREPNQQPLD